jgi:hypothetical protein
MDNRYMSMINLLEKCGPTPRPQKPGYQTRSLDQDSGLSGAEIAGGMGQNAKNTVK